MEQQRTSGASSGCYMFRGTFRTMLIVAMKLVNRARKNSGAVLLRAQKVKVLFTLLNMSRRMRSTHLLGPHRKRPLDKFAFNILDTNGKVITTVDIRQLNHLQTLHGIRHLQSLLLDSPRNMARYRARWSQVNPLRGITDPMPGFRIFASDLLPTNEYEGEEGTLSEDGQPEDGMVTSFRKDQAGVGAVCLIPKSMADYYVSLVNRVVTEKRVTALKAHGRDDLLICSQQPPSPHPSTTAAGSSSGRNNNGDSRSGNSSWTNHNGGGGSSEDKLYRDATGTTTNIHPYRMARVITANELPVVQLLRTDCTGEHSHETLFLQVRNTDTRYAREGTVVVDPRMLKLIHGTTAPTSSDPVRVTAIIKTLPLCVSVDLAITSKRAYKFTLSHRTATVSYFRHSTIFQEGQVIRIPLSWYNERTRDDSSTNPQQTTATLSHPENAGKNRTKNELSDDDEDGSGYNVVVGDEDDEDEDDTYMDDGEDKLNSRPLLAEIELTVVRVWALVRQAKTLHYETVRVQAAASDETSGGDYVLTSIRPFYVPKDKLQVGTDAHLTWDDTLVWEGEAAFPNSAPISRIKLYDPMSSAERRHFSVLGSMLSNFAAAKKSRTYLKEYCSNLTERTHAPGLYVMWYDADLRQDSNALIFRYCTCTKVWFCPDPNGKMVYPKTRSDASMIQMLNKQGTCFFAINNMQQRFPLLRTTKRVSFAMERNTVDEIPNRHENIELLDSRVAAERQQQQAQEEEEAAYADSIGPEDLD